MKVFNVFAHIFAIFAFLTIGSLLVIISIHILSVEDALAQLRELYASPWHSLQAGCAGIIFIAVGLTFSRILVKKRREAEALIFQSEIGPIIVSVTALDDVVKKVMKRFHLVKEWKTKTMIQGKDVEIKLQLILWSGSKIQELLTEIQQEIRSRLKKMLAKESQIEITCNVQRIEEHDSRVHDLEREAAASF